MVLGAPPLAEASVDRRGCDVKLLPYHAFALDSPMAPDVALRVLQARLERPSLFRITFPSSVNDSRFDGEIVGNKFSFIRIAAFQTAFTPRVLGEVRKRGRGAEINVRMRLHIQTIVIFAALGLLLFLLGAPVLTDLPNTGMMVLFIYGLAMLGFWYEASKQERVLRDLFRAEITTPLVA